MAATNGRYGALRSWQALKDPRSVAFADRLRQRRIACRLGVRECARRLGLSESHLSRLELAQRMPSRQVLALLVDVLDLSPTEADELHWLAGFIPPSLEQLETWPRWVTAACVELGREEAV